ncbi:MAG: iron ABC transporter permease [Sphaerochaetaceae bacterium]|nr:iron ABC transporter permease [Sphaerochaetaceae bacterium]
MKKKAKFDFWVIASLAVLVLYLLFMVYPLLKIVSQSVLDEKTGKLTMKHFVKFFSQPYYFRTLTNSFKVALFTCLISLVLGIPLAYFYNMYEIKGRKLLQMLIILSSMSAPFIGAYAWVQLLGRAGVITKLIKSLTGVTIPPIYGFNGILLVLSLKLFPLVFMYVSGAMKNVDKSLLEASANMGVSGVKRFFTVVIPLCMPSILAATLMVFMRSIADFGTPLMIGEGYTTFPVIIYKEYVGEMGTNHNFAAAIAVIAILITLMFFLVQRYLTKKNSFSMSAMNHVERKKAKPVTNFFIHLYGYGLVAVALLPQLYLVYLSFRKTNSSGEVFQQGFSLQSYQHVFKKMGNTIWNTVTICGLALILIIVLAILISYLTVRRRNVLNATIDTLSMVPYVIPGAVVGISMILAFNNKYMPLVGTAAIMVIAMCVRRIPYTIRSSVAILSQIPLSIDEAAESLGAGKFKTLVKVTIPMMFNGIFAGAIMSWVTLITELSSSMLLYSRKTQTLNIAVYKAVANATDGRACALATVVSVFTVISLILFNKVSKDGEIMM